jgi:hypothetical protein
MGMLDQASYDDLVSVAERVITLVLDRVMYEDLEEAQRINQMLKIINETKDARTKEQ